MKIIPFNIELRKDIQSEENKYQGRYKVQTKSGNTVRIICWDKKDFTFPIVALVKDSLPGSAETTLSFRQDGMYYPRGIKSYNDLCLIDTWEPKFKVGDRVRMGDNTFAHKIVDVREDGYVLSTGGFIEMSHQHLYSLVPAKTSNCFNVGDVIKCVDTGRLYLVCDGYNVLSDGHTTCIGGLYEAVSKEEADKFFKELDENGYIWNPEKRKIEKKEPELTDFEQEVRDIVTSALTVTSEDGSCSFTIAINDEAAREMAAGITKLINKKLYGCF